MNLQPGQHIHLMGICGTAMASLAGLLKSRGFKVTGSDQNPYPPMSTQLEKLQIPVYKGYSEKNLNPKPDFVIVGNVISAENPEAKELVRLGIEFTSLPKAMGEFIIQNRPCVCVSGTHGKTTTTSMMSWLADQAGLKPGFMIGGIPQNFSQSFQNPEGNLFIIEGDEYDTAYFDKVPKFIHYKPKHVILTSVEFDHADIYKDLDAVKSAFARLMKLIPREGSLIYWAEDENIQDLKVLTNTSQLFGYGFSKGDFKPEILLEDSEGMTFQIRTSLKSPLFAELGAGGVYGPFSMKLSGKYNVLNATAVIIQSMLLKIPLSQIQVGLKSFLGVKRRQEVRGEPRGILVIEDFAHHPTAVKETLQGLRARYKDRKLLAVFEPRSATSRRKIFQKDYARAFSVAQEVFLAQAFDQSKIQEADRFSSEELVTDIQKQGQKAGVYAGVDEIISGLVKTAQPKDVIVVMSNGGFDGIYEKLLKALNTEPPRTTTL